MLRTEGQLGRVGSRVLANRKQQRLTAERDDNEDDTTVGHDGARLPACFSACGLCDHEDE
jgi:hypothetical protein